MLTASQASKILNVLNLISECPYASLTDPAFAGKLRAEAFLASLPLKRVLENFQVEIEAPAPACIEE